MAARVAGIAALLAATATVLVAGQSWSTQSRWVRNEHTSVRLISAASGVGTGRELRLGLHFRMKPGWKIYWRSPGDAGFPPSLVWAGSRNVAGSVMQWPSPTRFRILGFTTMGYKDEVVLPLTVFAREPGKPVSLKVSVNYLTCADVCVPYQVKLDMDLPASAAMTTRHAYLISKFANKVPGDGKAAGLRIQRVEVARQGPLRTLIVTAHARERFNKPDVFIEGPPRTTFGAPKVTLLDGGRTARLLVPVAQRGDNPPKLAGAGLTLTMVDGARTVESRLTATLGQMPVAPVGVGYGLLAVLGLALLGGLILNLMPCVLPVLSIKLLSVVSHGGGEAAEVRRRFLATAAGILISFLILAAVLIGLKSAGASVGWGIQFQEPLFLIAILLVLTLFAANLWGLFEIRLPARLTGFAERAGRGRGGLAGDFLTGAFATLLATPCSAPFLGTAVSFALSGGPADIFAIFVALGMGLAAPYLLVAAVPAIATRMPRPGPWMVKLKFVLGLALAATAVWLISVLENQTGPGAAWMIGGLMAASILVLWARRRERAAAAPLGRQFRAPLVVLLFAGLAFATPSVITRSGPVGATFEAYWKKWDQAAIARHVASGKVVLVDVTADWCLTCKVNKRLVLGRGKVAGLLKGGAVVAMVADWTSHNDAITKYLASFGRYGIPFDVVYGPGAPQGIVLPELLTTTAVLDAIARARGATAPGKDPLSVKK